jgi:hypothetical protein
MKVARCTKGQPELQARRTREAEGLHILISVVTSRALRRV